MGFKILELYSGIGGMHCAWTESGLDGDVAAAIDINTVANEVYKFNFPETKLLTRNIQTFTPAEVDKLDANVILMSPPCQPFSRNGKYLDENDTRTNSFIYLINILHQLTKIEYILMENVKGFECSTVRNMFIKKLNECNFSYQEFLLSPTCVGVPNSRLRYYCMARRSDTVWKYKTKDEIIESLPKEHGEPYCLENILEANIPDKYLLKDQQLKRGKVLDVCHRESRRSCCFTKAYTHYIDGMGSVFTESSRDDVEKCFKKALATEVGSQEFVETLKELKIRFFTPNEILALMSFPKYYKFPDTITTKQCYRLLGNSVNVKVISELLKVLFD